MYYYNVWFQADFLNTWGGFAADYVLRDNLDSYISRLYYPPKAGAIGGTTSYSNDNLYYIQQYQSGNYPAKAIFSWKYIPYGGIADLNYNCLLVVQDYQAYSYGYYG